MQRRSLAVLLMVAPFLVLSGCKSSTTSTPVAQTKPKLGIRPYGDETTHIDMTNMPEDEKKAFKFIDEQRRRHTGVGGDGEGFLRQAGLPGDAG
jgi:hypothetical protein